MTRSGTADTRIARVERAVFGERNRGHALLSHTGLSQELQAELPGRTDIPAGAPPGVEWDPFISGYPVRDVYVLSRTFPDPAASRPGMVVTHALVMSLADLANVAELSDFLALLPSDANQRADLAPSSVPITSTEIAAQGARAPGELALARALLAVRDESVVWIAPPSFEPALVALWRHLWPEVRTSLSFRLSFGPADAGPGGPTIVTALPATTARWPRTRIVSHYSDEAPLTSAEAVLVGDEAGRDLLDFWRRSGARLARIRDLALLENAFRYSESRDGSFDSVGALVRLLAVVSPTPQLGTEIKERAMARLANSVSAARVEVLASIKNLNLAPFPGAEDLLCRSVEACVTNALDGNSGVPDGVIHVIADALGGEGPPWWTMGVVSAVRQQGPSRSESRIEVTWAVMAARPEQGEQWMNELPSDDKTDLRLTAACPAQLPAAALTRATQLAVRKKWERLHAALAIRASQPAAAIERHLSAFPHPSRESVETLVNGVGPKAVVAAALAGNEVFIPYAGRAVAADLHLATDIDAASPTWRNVWLAAIDAGAPAHLGLASPDALIDGLLSALRAGQSVETRLLAAVARAGTGNLHISKARREAWKLIPYPVRDHFLASTADAWLADALSASRSQGGVAPFEASVERELQSAILSRHRMGLLATEAGVPVDLALALFRACDGTTEDLVEDWTAKTTSRRLLTSAQAERLASLIRDRAWRRAASALFFAAEFASQYRAAARSIRHLVPRWDRVKSVLWGYDAPESATDDAWDFLIDVATDLYPWGPGEKDIWRRAGGDFARLEEGRSGEESWRNAISSIRKGSSGGVSAESLLRAMQEEFANNKQIQFLLKNVHWFR